MRIETKFDIGQEVWWIQSYFGDAPLEVKGPAMVIFISAHIDGMGGREKQRAIEYELWLGNGRKHELDIFPTEAEAVAECERRNQGASDADRAAE